MGETVDAVQLATGQLAVASRPATAGGTHASTSEPCGRSRELREIADLMDRVPAGEGRLVLLSGEAGVGKTYVADRIAARARQSGLGVIWGCCWEGEDAPPYWPWSQILRGVLQLHKEAAAVGQADAVSTLLGRILPQAGPATGSCPPPRVCFQLHDEVVRVVLELAARRPSLIVLDDVHAGSESDLSLLELLSAELRNAPLLVVATHRPLRPGERGARQLAGLLRGAVHLPLRGLDATAVAELAERVAGHRPSPAATARLLDVTGGNPFFLVEVIRALGGGGSEAIETPDGTTHVPAGVREAIRLRLQPLPSPVIRLLHVAAVVGREFDLSIVQAAAEVDADELLDGLSVAVECELIARKPAAPGRYAFAHGLYREVFYGDLPVVDRTHLHAAVADVLRQRFVGQDDLVATEIAHHHLEASPLIDAGTAASWTKRAARTAERARAYQEAARWHERTLELLVSHEGASEQTLRCALDAGEAQLRAGLTVESRRTFERAADIADRLGSGTGFAAAALGRAGGFYGYDFAAAADHVVIDLLQRAIDRIDASHGPLRVQLLSRLAVELHYTAHGQRRTELIEEAIALAARIGDDRSALVAGYSQLLLCQGPDDVETRRTRASAIIAAAQRLGDDELELRARHLRIVALLESGDGGAADAEIGHYARLARRSLRPLYHWQIDVLTASRAFATARFADTELHAQAALERGGPVLGTAARVAFGVQICQLRWAQGRTGEVLPAVRLFLEKYPSSAWAGALGFMEAEEGDIGAARTQLERLVGGRHPAVARDGNWIATLCLLTMTCHAVGDADRASILLHALSPYAKRIAIVNAGAASLGSVSVFLGLAAATAGDPDAATGYLEAGLAQNTAMGNRPLAAWTSMQLTQVLRQRGRQGDGVRAADIEGQLHRSAVELGMPWILERLDRDGPTPTAAGVEPAPPAASLKPDGDYWTVGTGDHVVRLRDSAGLRYLHRLLPTPGTEIHALDMVTTNGTRRRTVDTETIDGYDTGTGPLLDERAKRAYRQRLVDLDEDLQEATDHNDPERAASCRAEIDALTSQLTNAVGFGGRDRPSSSATERARVSVTKAIRRAISKIGLYLPELAHHLERSVRTGTYCSYEPAQARSWNL